MGYGGYANHHKWYCRNAAPLPYHVHQVPLEIGYAR